MRYQTLMHDLLFKETFADPHNRRQLEFFLEQILGYETGYLHNKLDVSYEKSDQEEINLKIRVSGEI